MNQCPRYTQIEFPPYRFIPGENPHPTEDPHGHSYGKKEQASGSFFPEDWRHSTPYLFGIDLYNYGYWWESHEALETLWRSVPRGHVSRDHLQGLIKISAAFIKWHLRKQAGFAHLYAGGREHLSKVAEKYPVYMGLNIVEHLQKLERHFKPVLRNRIWPDPATYPYITLTLLAEKQDLECILRAEDEGFGMTSIGYR